MTRKKWYMVIVTAIVLAFAITGLSIHFSRKSEKEQAMIFELRQLRSAVEIYVKIHREKPPDLPTALDAEYPFQTPKWSMGRNAAGMPLGPFGNLYRYNSQSGWVSSTTKGYEQW